jgi:hypothetical protein
MNKKLGLNSRQILFKEMFVGTLIYAIVLGFFNDYTSIVYAKSFSTIFLASAVLQALTYLAFVLKGQIIRRLKLYEGLVYQLLMFFFVWLVMFLSKFVFVWAIDLLFGNNMTINGFFGILTIVLSVTVLHRLADWIFLRLAD